MTGKKTRSRGDGQKRQKITRSKGDGKKRQKQN